MPSETKDLRLNKFLLIQILLLDLIGFSLIFPLVPDLLEYYLTGAKSKPIDSWLIPLKETIVSLLPESRRSDTNTIVLLGGILSSIYSLLQFIFSPYWGRLSDRIGRRKVLILTSFGLSFSYLIWAFTSDFTTFLISRVIGGIMAGNLGVATAAMADMSDRENRTKSMGLIGAAFGAGFVVGPVIGGISSKLNIMEYFPEAGFLNPFSFCALLSFLLSFASAMRNMLSFRETLAVSHDIRHTWIGNPVRALISVHSRGFYYLVAINFLYLTVFSGFEFTLTFFYKLDFRLDPYRIGFVFLYLGVIIASGQGMLIRFMTPKYGEKKIILAGLLIIPGPLALLAYSAPNISLSLLYLLPVAAGAALIMPSLTGLASLLSPADRQGLALGVFRSSGALARAVGPLIGAYLYWIFGVRISYVILAAVFVLILILAMRLQEIRKPSNSKK
jgi:MFS family permease